jgi:hypothetical protein
LLKKLRQPQKDTQKIISHDSLYIQIVKEVYAKTSKDHDKYNTQLAENRQIIRDLELVKTPDAYRQSVASAGIKNLTTPHKDSCITLIEKRIKNLGAEANNELIVPEIRAIAKVRQVQFAAVKNAYKELQQKALFPDKAEENKAPSSSVDSPFLARATKPSDK